MFFDAVRMGGSGPRFAPEIIGLFRAVGLPSLKGYGLTVSTPILPINRPGGLPGSGPSAKFSRASH